MSSNKLPKEQLFQELEKDGLDISEDLSKKAKRGMGDALLDIANLYYGKRDPVKEIAWLRLAAEKNSSHAQYRIGYKYFYGQGVPQNYLISIDFYILAVKGNHKTANLRLAQTLKNGCGVNSDNMKALEWYYKYDINHDMIKKLENEGYELDQKHKDKSLSQLIKETEEIIGQEKERCMLSKNEDLTNLNQTKETFQRDLININKEMDLLELENIFLKDELKEKEDKIKSMKIASQNAAIMYVQEKKKMRDKFNHELAEKDKKIRFLQNTTENLMRLMEKMKQERHESEEVSVLGFSSCHSPKQDIASGIENMSMLEGSQESWR